jgi:hypothetical protein
VDVVERSADIFGATGLAEKWNSFKDNKMVMSSFTGDGYVVRMSELISDVLTLRVLKRD